MLLKSILNRAPSPPRYMFWLYTSKPRGCPPFPFTTSECGSLGGAKSSWHARLTDGEEACEGECRAIEKSCSHGVLRLRSLDGYRTASWRKRMTSTLRQAT